MRKALVFALLLSGCGRTVTAPERCVRWQPPLLVDTVVVVEVGVVVPCEASRGD